jgi:protocatechuate 3,4-dioxygenase beta subunit
MVTGGRGVQVLGEQLVDGAAVEAWHAGCGGRRRGGPVAVRSVAACVGVAPALVRTQR